MTGWLLHHVPTVGIILLVIVVPTLLAVLGLRLVQRRVEAGLVAENNPVGDPIFAILGTIYAVVLAFMVVVGWQEYADVAKDAEEEATTALNLYRDARGFPEPVRSQIRTQIRRYAEEVKDREWESMSRQQTHPRAQATIDELWRLFTDYEPATVREQVIFAEAFAKLNDLGKQREIRVLASQTSIPDLFWVLLMAGGAVTMGFTYFLGTPNRRAHLAMTGLLAAMITSALFLTMVLDHPFTGDFRLQPGAFEESLAQMGTAAR